MSVSYAERLPEAKCEGLRTQKKNLINSGVLKKMEKGPKWAKANLEAQDLNEIKSYIAVLETLMFQCSEPLATKPKDVMAQRQRKPVAQADKKNKIKKEKLKVKQTTKVRAIPLPVRKPFEDFIAEQIKSSPLISIKDPENKVIKRTDQTRQTNKIKDVKEKNETDEIKEIHEIKEIKELKTVPASIPRSQNEENAVIMQIQSEGGADATEQNSVSASGLAPAPLIKTVPDTSVKTNIRQPEKPINYNTENTVSVDDLLEAK